MRHVIFPLNEYVMLWYTKFAMKRNAELDIYIYQLEWRALHGRGHYCGRAKPATPLNIKLSAARRSASADDGSQMSSLLAAVAATHAPPP